jgi:acyl carrier protein
MPLTRDKLVEFLETELGLEVSGLQDSTLLFSSGIIDSFMMVSLMTFMEKQGGFRIAPTDVNLANLDSIERILAFSTRMT